ncbi:hypothetical protein BDV59DRAFT_160989 [Aspergillus ambiguus]|uniref:uncharacterized protein n=1 Tax=Aspergillus ambiguus TaxID=176160 RepID=UPI003CCDF635
MQMNPFRKCRLPELNVHHQINISSRSTALNDSSWICSIPLMLSNVSWVCNGPTGYEGLHDPPGRPRPSSYSSLSNHGNPMNTDRRHGLTIQPPNLPSPHNTFMISILRSCRGSPRLPTSDRIARRKPADRKTVLRTARGVKGVSPTFPRQFLWAFGVSPRVPLTAELFPRW